MRYAILTTLLICLASGPAPATDKTTQSILKLGLSGNQAVTDQQLRSAILLDPDCVQAVHDRGLQASLKLIAKRVFAGYQAKGYVNAVVEPDAGSSGLHIVESTRFRMGELTVAAGSPVPNVQLAKALHAAASQQLDGFASFPLNTRKLLNAANLVYERYGFFGATFEMTPDVRPEHGTVDLRVVVQPGPRSRLTGLVLEGNQRSDEQELRGIVGPVENTVPTPALLDDIRSRLTALQQFRSVDVALDYPIGPGAPLDLKVTITERDILPATDDVGAIVNRFSGWLEDWSAGLITEDLVINFKLPSSPGSDSTMPAHGRVLVSNSGDCLLTLGDVDHPEISIASHGGVVDTYVRTAGERFRIPSAAVVAALSLSSLPPGSDEQTSMEGSVGIQSPDHSQGFQLAVDSDVILRSFQAKHDGADLSNDDLELTSERATLVIRKSTGQLIRFNLSDANGTPVLTIQTTQPSTRAAIADHRQETAKYPEGPTPLNLLSQTASIPGLPEYLLHALQDVFPVFSQQATNTAFRIPVHRQAAASMSQRDSALLVFAVLAGERAPLDGADFTLLRAAVLRSMGHGQLASAMAEPFVQDTSLDPVQCWLAALAHRAHKRTLAQRGLELFASHDVSNELAARLTMLRPKPDPDTSRANKPGVDFLAQYLTKIVRQELTTLSSVRARRISVLDKKRTTGKKKKPSQKSWASEPLDTSSVFKPLRNSRRKK